MSRGCAVERRPGPLGRIVSAQAAQPRGLLGRAMGRLWISETAAANDRAIDLLAPVPGEHVLEIGFGPGRTIRELAARAARVTGIEVSTVMLDQARRRNATAVQRGQVQLHAGPAGAIPLPAAAVEAVLAVHTLYFWPDLDAGFREIHRVLAPAGRVVLVFRAAEHGLPRRFDPAVYRVPTTDRVRRALDTAGFRTEIVEHDPHGTAFVIARTAHCDSGLVAELPGDRGPGRGGEQGKDPGPTTG